MSPAGVIRAMALPGGSTVLPVGSWTWVLCSVNHMLPSGPATILNGSLTLLMGNSVKRGSGTVPLSGDPLSAFVGAPPPHAAGITASAPSGRTDRKIADQV